MNSNDSYISEPQQTSSWAVISVISGIASYIFLPLLAGVIALVAGYMARNEIKESDGKIGGSGLATAGLILGWVNLAGGLVVCCLIALAITGVLSGIAICGPLSMLLNGSTTY